MHFRILKILTTSGFLTALNCTKFVFARCSASDPAGGADSGPPYPLDGSGKGGRGGKGVEGKERERERGK